jgi:hypothetical protein
MMRRYQIALVSYGGGRTFLKYGYTTLKYWTKKGAIAAAKMRAYEDSGTVYEVFDRKWATVVFTTENKNV